MQDGRPILSTRIFARARNAIAEASEPIRRALAGGGAAAKGVPEDTKLEALDTVIIARSAGDPRDVRLPEWVPGPDVI
jgi:hypothetical protein